MKNEKHVMNIILGARKILSVNSLYAAKMVYHGSRQIATIYKSSEAKRTEEYIKEQVRALDVPNNFPWINKDVKFKMTIKIVFSSGFLLRDLDNTLKLLQDGIFRALDINDSHVIFINASKLYFPGLSEEKIYVSLQEVDDKDFRLDLTPHPGNVWSNGILSFDPLPKRKKKDTIYLQEVNREEADTFTYIISPNNFSPDIFADIMQDLDLAIIEGNRFMFLGILGNKTDWTEENRLWIDCIFSRFNGCGSKKIKAEWIKEKNDVIEKLKLM